MRAKARDNLARPRASQPEDFSEVEENENPDQNTNLGTTGRKRPYHTRTHRTWNPMGRYVFPCAVNKFVRQRLDEGDWSDATAYERERLLYRIERDLKKVLKLDRIDPRKLAIEDIRLYIRWLRERSKRNGSTQRKALLLLTDFLKDTVGNLAGEKLRKQFPPETSSDKPRPPFEELSQGFDRLGEIADPWQKSIARGQAALYIGTMVRPSEGRLALKGDLDERSWVLRVRRPKGHTRERRAPFINDRCKAEMSQYLVERAEMLKSVGHNPNDPRLPLFPALEWGVAPHHYTQQAFNRIWAKAFPGTEHYCARRGMAQEAVDRDPKLLGAVSQMLGHSNISTTLKYYAKPTMERVREELEQVWKPVEPETISTRRPTPPDPSYQ